MQFWDLLAAGLCKSLNTDKVQVMKFSNFHFAPQLISLRRMVTENAFPNFSRGNPGWLAPDSLIYSHFQDATCQELAF